MHPCLDAFLALVGVIALVILPEPVTGEGLPIACGIFGALPPGMVCGRIVELKDGAGRPVPAVFRRFRRGYRLHAVLPAGGGTRRVLRVGRRRPRVTLPPLRTSVTPRGGLIGLPDQSWELLPGGIVCMGEWTFAPWPAATSDGEWKLRSNDPLRIDVTYEGHLAPRGEGARLRFVLALTIHRHTDRVAISIHADARRVVTLTRGLGLLVRSGEGLGLRGRDRVLLRAATGPLTGARESASVWRLERRKWTSSRNAALEIQAGDPLLVEWGSAFPIRDLELRAGGRELLLLGAPAGARLRRGEGRILRFRLGFGGCEPPYPALVIPGSALRRAGGGTTLVRRPMRGNVAALTEPLIAKWLRDPWHGLQLEGPDAGDWLMGRETVGNLEYDTVLGLLQRAHGLSDVRAFETALTCLDQSLARDRDAGDTGLFIPHGAGHRGAQVEPGHHWIEGVLLAEHWTMDPLLTLEVDRILASQLRTFTGLTLDQALPRDLGWGLLALGSGAVRSQDHAGYRRAVLRWRRHILARQHARGPLCLVPDRGRKGLFRINPFVQGGILAPALARSLLFCPSGADRKRIRRLARFLARHGMTLVDGVSALPRRITFDSRAGRVTGFSAPAEGEHAALFLAGITAADPALRSHRNLHALRGALTGQLRASRKRYTGREMSLLMRALPGLEGW